MAISKKIDVPIPGPEKQTDYSYLLPYLNQAMKDVRNTLENTPQNHENYAARLGDLADMLYLQYQANSDDLVLEELIRTSRASVKATRKGDFDLGTRLNRLSRVLHTRLTTARKGSKDLVEALDAALKAESATPQEHVYKRTRQSFVASLLEIQFNHGNVISYLKRAIVYGRLAVKDPLKNESKSDHSVRLGHLSHLCIRLWELGYHRGNDALLNEAVNRAQLAEKQTQRGDPDKAKRMLNLSVRLMKRYEQDSRMNKDDIDHAVDLATAVVDTTTALDNRRGTRLKILAHLHRSRYEHGGEEKDFIAAIDNARAALKSLKCDAHNSLALTYMLHFRRTSARSNLEMAITHARKAMNLRISGIGVERIQSGLATMLQLKFKHFGETKALQDATSLAKRVVELTAGADITRATSSSSYENNLQAGNRTSLARILMTRFKQGRNVDDMLQAVEHSQKAVELTEHSDPNWPKRVAVFARAVVLLHDSKDNDSTTSEDSRLVERVDWPSLLSHVTQVMNTAVHGVEGASRADMLCNLGRILDFQDDWQSAIQTYKEAISRGESATPLVQIRTRRELGILYADKGLWNEAFAMFSSAISLLPLVSFRWLSLDEHEQILSQLAGLSSLVAAAALETGKEPVEALVWAEKGRGVIANLASGAPTRRPSGLPGDGNTIMHEFYNLQRFCNAGPSELGAIPAGSSTDGNYNKRLREVSEKICKSAPDMSEQLSEGRLKKLAGNGPIVSFNITKYGCGAFLITRDAGVQFMKLGGLHEGHIEGYAKYLREMKIGVDSSCLNDKLREILAWLWKQAVEPVLIKLHITAGSVKDRPTKPRIWWVASGLLGSFPLHVAGLSQDPGVNDNVLHRVVSSYVPTVRSLQLSRHATRRKAIGSGEYILAITAPDVHGKAELNVHDEMKAIEEAIRDSPFNKIKERSYPTTKDVLKGLEKATLVHFACHGESKVDSPSKSCLILNSKGTRDYERLSAGQLIELGKANRLPKSGLAYLSACSMAQNCSRALVDEVIHPANALFRAGFPNVVAPLWETRDHSAPDRARRFYSKLAQGVIQVNKGGAATADRTRHVADALHWATVSRLQKAENKQFRNLRKQPAEWASFVHIGC